MGIVARRRTCGRAARIDGGAPYSLAMAIFHVSTSTPTKLELIERWAPTQPWAEPADTPLVSLGSFHFDDPEGSVGMETHLIDAGGTILQVPLTYRDSRVDAAAESLVGTLEHSVLGTRWVYDGLGDDRYVMLLAAVSLTGQGQALGMASFDGRWYIAPTTVSLTGGGWSLDPAPVDGFRRRADGSDVVTFSNDHFDLTVHRRPRPDPRPSIGLTASTRERPDSIVLTEMRARGGASTTD